MTIPDLNNERHAINHAELLFNDGNLIEAEKICDKALQKEQEVNHAPILYLKGKIARVNNQVSKAINYFADAIRHDVNNQQYRNYLIKFLLEVGALAQKNQQTETAKHLFRLCLDINPNCAAASNSLIEIEMHGEEYYDLLARLHNFLKPKTYLEIGVSNGLSMTKALSNTLAIGIDPVCAVDQNFVAETKLFNLTSNDFFASHNLHDIIDGSILDMAFIDGLHTFEQVLSDFINVESYSGPRTVILVHDCLPLDRVTASTERISGFWTGDVWKLLPALAKFRPDLNIFVTPTPPSGLAIITNVNAKSAIKLKKHCQQMISEFSSLTFDDFERMRYSHIRIIPNNWSSIKENLS